MSDKNYHTDNNSFVIYKDWEELVLALDSDEERGRLFLALFSYAKEGKQPVDFSGSLKMAFLFMKNAIHRDGLKWEETCAKRSECGSLGGRPKGKAKKANGFSEKQKNQKKAKEADNDTENETDTDTDSDMENEKEKEIETDTLSPSAPDFSAVELSDDQLSSLVSFSSRPLVESYIEKARQWQVQHKRKYKDPYKTILGWIQADKAKNPVGDDKQTSYNIDKIQAMADNFISRNGGRNGE